jgi:glycopeptide antibiotics resistance protein
MLIRFDAYDYLLGVGVLVVLLPIVWRRKQNLSSLLFFSVFWIYLLAVVQAVIFPIAINTNQAGTTFSASINLIPFYFGSCFNNMPGLCARGLLENILLTLPLGFGLNFLVRVKTRNFIWLAAAVGVVFELLQLVIAYIFKSGFRAVDINDAMLNAAGVLLGYALFRVFARVYLEISSHFGFKQKWLFADIYKVVIQTHAADRKANPAEEV